MEKHIFLIFGIRTSNRLQSATQNFKFKFEFSEYWFEIVNGGGKSCKGSVFLNAWDRTITFNVWRGFIYFSLMISKSV